MTAPVGVGFVGCGMIAGAHAAALRLLAEDGTARLVAGADPDPSGLDRVAAIVGGIDHRFTSAAELVACPDVDVVVVITPTRHHREAILATVDAGKPLFTEKPLAPTFDGVAELYQAVVRSNLPAQVGFQSRHNPLYRRLHEIVVTGELGAPMAYSVRNDQYWPTGDVVEGHSSWRSDRGEAGGGALLEHSIHSCDLLANMFGAGHRVFATTRHVFGYSVEDTAALTIEHRSGVVGNLVTIFNGVTGREETRIEVFFEHGAVEVTTDFVVGAPEESMLIHRPGRPSERVDIHSLRREWFERDAVDPERQIWVYQYLAHRAFLRSLASGVAPSPGFDDAWRAHAIVEAGYRSARSGAPEAVQPVPG